jgi:phosphate transport system ATP-binding protein
MAHREPSTREDVLASPPEATDPGGDATRQSGATGLRDEATDHPAERAVEGRRFVEASLTPDQPLNSKPASVMECKGLNVYYGSFHAVHDVNIPFAHNEITALIGPSGCGKSTVLRCLNRMNDLIQGARVEGEITFRGESIYGPGVDAIEVRRRIGMVFQKPNPFPKSIFDNVAYGPRVIGMKVDSMEDTVEGALRGAALWDEVKDKLHQNAFGLSGGQQQRLCIARTIAVRPDVILMDEPCSALDPIATARIEDLMQTLREDFTLVVVTHNMQQAARVSDRTAFFTAQPDETTGNRTGILVEFDTTSKIFSNPSKKETEAYITGRFG